MLLERANIESLNNLYNELDFIETASTKSSPKESYKKHNADLHRTAPAIKSQEQIHLLEWGTLTEIFIFKMYESIRSHVIFISINIKSLPGYTMAPKTLKIEMFLDDKYLLSCVKEL